MGRVAVDFGTSNTVLARVNEATGSVETVEMAGVTTAFRYHLAPDTPEQVAHVVPSLIHYSDTETLIGEQVLSRGLAEHRHTLRWMKRGIAHGHTQRRKTPQGHKGPAQAGEDFLTLLLNYASDRVSFSEDEFTFTAPVEAFEHFQDWLRRLCEGLGIRRLRMLDEPTACVLGYHGAARKDDRFVIFDFGGGTLDVSAVRIDLAAMEDRKAVQLGQAGCDLGGMDIDQWLAEDFCARHHLSDPERRDLEAVILRQAETTKIELSNPQVTEADLAVVMTTGKRPRAMRTTYARCCPKCRNHPACLQCPHRTGGDPAPEACLGCLLREKGFAQRVRETMDRALENAAVKAGMRRSDVVQTLVTGGTSLVPCVQSLLADSFGARADGQNPFGAVAGGACRGTVVPILQHDYAIESYNRQAQRYEFAPLFRMGTEYPTNPDSPVRLWGRGAYDGQPRIGLHIYEVSRMTRTQAGSMFDERGRIRDDSRVQTDCEYACLNKNNPTFIVADPPVNLERDKKRFLC
ncbi:MAG: Hsp70 family protein, partial [Planctomycetota bacterium]